MPYRKIEPKLWDDELIADLDRDTKLVWVYLLTGKHTTSLPGLWIATTLIIADGLRAPVEVVEKALVELERLGRIVRDQRRRLIRVPKSPRHNPADNARVVKGWWNQWADLPDCALKYEHIASLRDGVDGEKTTAAWDEYFGKIDVVRELARFANQARTRQESFANDSEPAPNSSSVPAPVLVPVGSDPDPEIQDPSQADPEEITSEIAGAREEQQASHGEPRPRPAPPAAGLPPGVRLGRSDRHHRAPQPGGAVASNDDARVIHEALRAHEELRNVATERLAGRIASRLLGGKKPLPEAVESIAAVARKVGDRRAANQHMSDADVADMVVAWAIKPWSGASPRASPHRRDVQDYTESHDAIRSRNGTSIPIRLAPDGEIAP